MQNVQRGIKISEILNRKKMPNSGGIFLDKYFKIRKRLDDKSAQKNSDRKFRRIGRNSWKFKVKKYAVKMAIFSKFNEKFKNKILKKGAFNGK